MTKKFAYTPFYEQVGTPLIGPDEDLEDELTELEDFDLPTRAELDAKEQADDTAAAGAKDKPAGADAGGDAAGGKAKQGKDGDGEGAGEADAEGTKEDETVLAGAADTGPVYQATLADPGEFKPGDHSFDVTVYDQDGKNGKVVSITSVEQFEQLLEEDKNFGSAAALMKAQRQSVKLENALEQERKDYDKLKAEYQQEQDSVKAANDQLTQMAAEFDYLTNKGELPPVARKYVNADWTDPEVAKQPGIKERAELLQFIEKENSVRAKLGIKPFSSVIDAFNQFDRERAKTATKDKVKQAGEIRRAAGARVAGSSPAPVNGTPKGMLAGRVMNDFF